MAETRNGTLIGLASKVYPSEWQGLPDVTITIVLVAGNNNDYAAYAGVGHNDWIKTHGRKLTFREASAVFPLEEEKYRE